MNDRVVPITGLRAELPHEPTDAERDHAHALRLIEALLFASPEPLGDAQLAARLPEGMALAPLLDELQRFYRFRGITLVRVAEAWTFRTAADLAGHLAIETVQTRKLTRAQIETLAIIAYHQPVTRAEIEEVRGVTLHRGTLDLLMEAGWIQPKGRRETPGRPITWVTTEGFLLHFGLDSVRDLPNRDELKAAGLLDASPTPVSLGEGAPRPESEEAADEAELSRPLDASILLPVATGVTVTMEPGRSSSTSRATVSATPWISPICRWGAKPRTTSTRGVVPEIRERTATRSS